MINFLTSPSQQNTKSRFARATAEVTTAMESKNKNTG
jgi:hypothetical protein